MSANVNVLKALSYHAHQMTKKFGPDNELAEAHAAIKELIEADCGYDNARSGAEVTQDELSQTKARRAAALSRILGDTTK